MQSYKCRAIIIEIKVDWLNISPPPKLRIFYENTNCHWQLSVFRPPGADNNKTRANKMWTISSPILKGPPPSHWQTIVSENLVCHKTLTHSFSIAKHRYPCFQIFLKFKTSRWLLCSKIWIETKEIKAIKGIYFVN